MTRKASPEAANELMNAIADGEDEEESLGATDCPEGCFVEPDGSCSHGYESAALTLGVI